MKRMLLFIGSLLIATTASAYTLKQRSYRGPDGKTIFACVTKPFDGAIAFVSDDRFASGVTALVVPASNYPAVIRYRYPTTWYEAAITDIAGGAFYTPAARQFARETGKIPTVMFQAESDGYGNFDRPHLPIDPETMDRHHERIEAAVTNCRLRGQR